MACAPVGQPAGTGHSFRCGRLLLYLIQQSLKARVSVQWLQVVVGGQLAGICKSHTHGLLQLVERLIAAAEDSQAAAP